MAEIIISGSFEALALSKPSANKKPRTSKKTPNVKKKKITSRMSRDQFLELSKANRRRYLERFPMSTHRKLMRGEKDLVKEKEPKSKKAKPDPVTKKISQEEFERLSKKEQKEYKKKYPKDSFRGKKHFIVKKQSATQARKKGPDGETIMDGSEGLQETRNRRKLHNKALKQERSDAKQEIRHNVTREAVEALRNTKPEDMKKAARNMAANRTENINSIKDTLEKKDEYVSFKQSDIDSVKNRIRKEFEDEDSAWSHDDLKKAKKLADRLKEGDTNKLSKEERDTLDGLTEDRPNFPTKREPFWKRDLKVLKGFVTGEELDPDGRSNAMLALSVVSRYALLGAGIAVLAMGAAPAALHITRALFEQWDDFNSVASDSDEDEVEDALSMAYDAVQDHIANMDHAEMLEDVAGVFKEFTSVSSAGTTKLMSELYKTLDNVGCTIKSKSLHHISGVRNKVSTDLLIEAFTQTVKYHGYRRHKASGKEKEGVFSEVFVKGSDRVSLYSNDQGDHFTVTLNKEGISSSLDTISI